MKTFIYMYDQTPIGIFVKHQKSYNLMLIPPICYFPSLSVPDGSRIKKKLARHSHLLSPAKIIACDKVNDLRR